MVAQVKTIHATAERDGNWWLVYVPEVDRWTQARKLADVAPMASDLAALMMQVDPEDVEVADVTVKLPEHVRQRMADAERLRKKAAAANRAAAEAAREAARELKDDGLTVRDIGQALNVSHQRAHQLVKS